MENILLGRKIFMRTAAMFSVCLALLSVCTFLAMLCRFSQYQGFNGSEVEVARATFSNLIGGISYFFGQSK